MRKRHEELNQVEEDAFVAELTRLFIFGSACLAVAADNANCEQKGWPTIDIGANIEVPLCDALDLLREGAKTALFQQIRSIPIGVIAESHTNLEDLSIHEAMHDAFCLGIALVTMMEMDFRGVDELVEKIRKANDDAAGI